MRLAIVGAGNVGSALGRGWARAGHEIIYGVRDPHNSKHTEAARGAGLARLATVAEAAKDADVIVLAVQWSAAKAALEECGDLAGRLCGCYSRMIDSIEAYRPIDILERFFA